MPWKRKRILILTPLSSFSRLFAFFRKIISHVIFKMIGLYDKDKDVAIKLPRTYIYNRSWWFLSRRESQSNFIFSKFVSFSESHAKDPKTRPFFRQTLTSPFFSLLFLTLEHIFHYSTPIFFEARRQFLKHGPSLSPKDLSKTLLDRSIEHLSLFARGKIRGFFFFSPHQFQFLFSQFPTCGVVGRKAGVVPSGLSGDVDRCREQKTAILKPGGELFARLFVDTFALPLASSSLTFLLLLLLLLAPLPLSRLSRLSRLTRLRESHS